MNRQQRRAQTVQEKKAGNGAASPAPYVCVGIPSQDKWFAKFGMCLLQMFLDGLTQEVPGIGKLAGIRIHNIQGSTIWRQRQQLIELAIKDGSTHILFIDCDQTFPPSTLRRLLYHQKPVVACNVATKQIPSIPTARKLIGNGEPMPVFTTENSKGLEKVWRIGTGIMLVDLSIIPTLEEPWFQVSSSNDSDHYGEDWWFCQQIEKAGFDIFIDHELSWEVGHIGMLTYGHEHISQDVIAEVESIILDGTADDKASLLKTLSKRLEAQ